MIDCYKIEIIIPKELDSEDARRRLLNAVYKASVIFYEVIGEYGQLTDNKKLHGNGHHMAQELSMNAAKIWDERLIDNEKQK